MQARSGTRTFSRFSCTQLMPGLTASISRFHEFDNSPKLCCFLYGFLHAIAQSWPGALQVQIPSIQTPPNSVAFRKVSFKQLLKAGLKALHAQIPLIPHSPEHFHFLDSFLHTIAESWPGGLQVQITRMQTLSRPLSFSLWPPLHNCPGAGLEPSRSRFMA